MSNLLSFCIITRGAIDVKKLLNEVCVKSFGVLFSKGRKIKVMQFLLLSFRFFALATNAIFHSTIIPVLSYTIHNSFSNYIYLT